MKRFILSIVCVGLIFTSFVFTSPVSAYYTNMPASVVVGQPDFISNSANQGGSAGANTLGQPWAVFTDGKKLFVSELSNNRVLVWNDIPTSNNTPADIVLGQPDMTTTSAGTTANKFNNPNAVFVDPATGKLFVVDYGNARVLIYNQVPTTNGASADVVLGQQSFITSTQNNVSYGLWFPYDVTVSQGKVIVADAGNDRVAIWNTIPTTNGAAIDVAIGQTSTTSVNFRGSSCTSVSASTLNLPEGVATDYLGRLYITDNGNFRALIYNSIPTTSGAAANLVIGQPDFTICNTAPVSANSLASPTRVGVLNNRLFISSSGENRVLIYNSLPLSNQPAADMVIGQQNFTSNSANQGGSVSSQGFSFPYGLAVDPNKKILVVAELSNNRVLIFNNVITTPALSISSVSDLGSGKFRLSGNVVLGERPNYSLQNLKINVNGQGEGDITNKDGGNDNGPSSSMYLFWHDIEPWAGSNGEQKDWVTNPSGMLSSLGFTAAIRASSYNADEDKVFYFTPFSLDKVKQTTTTDTFPSFSFTVNKNQRNEMKSNLKYYQVFVKKGGIDPLTKKEYDYTKYIDSIPVDFDSVAKTTDNIHFLDYLNKSPNNEGIYETKDILVNYSNTSSKITVKSKTPLSPGTYLVQIKAINIMNREQQSNTLNLTILKRTIPATNPVISSPVPTNTYSPVPSALPSPGPTPTPFPTPTHPPAGGPKTCFLFWCW